MARRRGARVWIVLGALALVAVFLIASFSRSNDREAAEVRMETVRRDRLESWVRAPGDVRPERLVQISSNLMGRVQGLAVAEGDRVHKGDVLLRLDDERYRSTLAGMEAQVEAAQAELRLAKAQLDLSRVTLERQEKLFRDSLLSDEALDQARAQAAMDEARHAAAREALRLRESGLAEARKDYKETVFHAPIDGIVTALNVEEGENVVTGTMNNPGTVIMTLADLDTMEVEAEVDETDVVRVREGQPAKVKTDAWEDSVLAGVVTKVGLSGQRGSASGQQEGTNYIVRVRIISPPEGLRPGMSADVEVLAGERDSALVVPIQALVAPRESVYKRWLEARDEAKAGRKARKVRPPRGEEESDTLRASGTEKLVEGIFLGRDKKAFFVPARLGLRGDTHVEVSGEIKPGDKVITGPYRTLRRLKDGDAVRPEKKKKAKKNEQDQPA